MLIATKTLKAIDDAMQKDQGATFRRFLGQLMPLAGDAYRDDEDDWRDHLGASLIGRECAREVWYGFHWTTLKRFDGRMLRLFNRGHLEEPRFVAMLLMIGCKVWQFDQNGKQFRISGHKNHFGGSMDAVAMGIPDLPLEEPFLGEFKTHNDTSFAKLIAVGVMAAKWEHFVQMQIYMGDKQLRYGLYMAVNKNDDAIHAEIVQFDLAVYNRYRERSIMIIDSREPPAKINQSPGWFKCKWCDHKGVCHGSDMPARNCRTCEWIDIGDNGAWICNLPTQPDGGGLGEILTPKKQRLGCDQYSPNPVFKNKV